MTTVNSASLPLPRQPLQRATCLTQFPSLHTSHIRSQLPITHPAGPYLAARTTLSPTGRTSPTYVSSDNSWEASPCAVDVAPTSVSDGCFNSGPVSTTVASLAPPPSPTQTTVPTEPTVTSLAPPPTHTQTALPTEPTTTSLAPPPSTTQAPPPTKPTATSSHDLSLLWNCAPLGLDQCSFSVQDYVGLQNYSVIVGSPVSNCYNATTTIDSKIQGTISLSDTWSESLSIGIQFGSLNLGESTGWSSTETRSFSQGLTIHVQPGQQGAFIAVVQYEVTSGSMVVGSNDISPVFSNQPTGRFTYGGKVIGCDETFDANITAPIPASSALRIPVLSSTWSVSVILVVVVTCVL